MGCCTKEANVRVCRTTTQPPAALVVRATLINFLSLRHSSHAASLGQLKLFGAKELEEEDKDSHCDLLVTQMDTPIRTRAMPASVAGGSGG